MNEEVLSELVQMYPSDRLMERARGYLPALRKHAREARHAYNSSFHDCKDFATESLGIPTKPLEPRLLRIIAKQHLVFLSPIFTNYGMLEAYPNLRPATHKDFALAILHNKVARYPRKSLL